MDIIKKDLHLFVFGQVQVFLTKGENYGSYKIMPNLTGNSSSQLSRKADIVATWK